MTAVTPAAPYLAPPRFPALPTHVGGRDIRGDRHEGPGIVAPKIAPWSSPTRRSPAASPRAGSRSTRTTRAPPALERRRPRRPLLPGLPQQPLPVHRCQGRAGGADRARRGRRRASVRPPPRRVRARLDARADPAARRSRRPVGGEELSGPARPAHPLDRRLHRPGLGRARDARALERREPADHDLSRHEDRADLVHADDRARRRRRTARRRSARSTRARRARPRAATGRTSRPANDPRHRRHGLRRPARRACAARARAAGPRARARPARGDAARRPGAPSSSTGDVTDPGVAARGVAGVDTVVHLVSIIKGSRADFDRIMAQGTRNLVAAAKEAGVRRFVLASALGLDEHDEGRGAVLRGEVGDGAGREGVRARPRDLPAELRLRQGRRRAADVRPARALRARDADRRAGNAAAPADLGRGRRASTTRARSTSAPPRTARSSSAAPTRRPGTSSGTG